METVGNHLFNTLMQSCIVIVGDKLTNDTPHLALMPNPGRVIADVDPEEVLPAFVEQSIHRWES
jgi:hypothetical protein